MGCIILQQELLELIQSNTNDIEYDFGYTYIQYQNKQQQQLSYLVFDLNEFITLHNIPVEDRFKKEQCFIAGIFTDNMQCLYYRDYLLSISNNIKEFLKLSINNNIYFQLGQFEQGFQNIICSLSDYIYSKEINRIIIDDQDTTTFSVALMMKYGNLVYLSKSLGVKKPLNNKFLAKLKNKKEYIEIYKDHLTLVDTNMFLLNAQISNHLSEIILSSSLCSTKNLINVDPSKFPRRFRNNHDDRVFYLKIKINSQSFNQNSQSDYQILQQNLFNL